MVKGEMIGVEHYYAKSCSADVFRRLYKGYEAALRGAGLLDFDDMLVMCRELFDQRADILQAWQRKYRYILIDEFQDCLLYTSKDHKRPDGRAVTEIRRLAAEVDLLPRVHGSGMFTRGQTQILNACTLAPLSEAQRLDGLDENETSKRYMHHYNFPSFSVGETKPSRGPGRREIGHGALAERALVPVLPSEEEFPYAIRLSLIHISLRRPLPSGTP